MSKQFFLLLLKFLRFGNFFLEVIDWLPQLVELHLVGLADLMLKLLKLTLFKLEVRHGLVWILLLFLGFTKDRPVYFVLCFHLYTIRC